MQAELQDLVLKGYTWSFKACTHESSGPVLSQKEIRCIQAGMNNFIEARCVHARELFAAAWSRFPMSTGLRLRTHRRLSLFSLLPLQHASGSEPRLEVNGSLRKVPKSICRAVTVPSALLSLRYDGEEEMN